MYCRINTVFPAGKYALELNLQNNRSHRRSSKIVHEVDGARASPLGSEFGIEFHLYAERESSQYFLVRRS